MAALVVEDGTGKADADSYNSVTAIRTFWLNRGVDLTEHTDEVLGAKAREAFDYINTIGRYKGAREFQAQRGQFPRLGLVDWDGFTVTGVPGAVTDAHCTLTRAALDGPLYTDLDRGGKITSESIGPLSTSYAYDAPVGKVFRAAMAFLQPFVRDVSQQFAPFIGGVAGGVMTPADGVAASSEAIFGVGMHSDTGGVE